EPVSVFFPIEVRKHCPAIGIVWCLLKGPFQSSPRRGVLLRVDAVVVGKAAQQRFVRGQLLGSSATKSFAHRSGENSARVGDRRDDTRDELILQREDFFGAERTVISLGPKMGTGIGVDELHGDSQHGPRLAKTPFHYVTRAEFLANGADVARGVRVSRGGAPRDNSEVRETRKAGH